jgi:hypothetical protein
MSMLSRFRAAAGVLRPRSLAHTAKSVEDLVSTTARLHQRMKDSAIESARLAELSRRLEAELRALKEGIEQRDARHAAEVGLLNESLKGVELREAQLAAIYRADRALAADVEALPAVLDLDAIAAHTRSAIESAPLHLEPFPHLVVENVWPEAFYEALIKGLPPAELFADRPINKRRLAVPFDWAPIYSSRVWDFLVNRVLDRVVAPMVVKRFREPLGAWLLANWPLPAEAPTEAVRFHSTDGRILLRHRGYNIPPHRDPKWSFITCLAYLVRPGDSERWGTQLYSVQDDIEAPSVAAYWIKAERCRLEKDVPFRRNSMLIFLNSHGAHGASIPEDAEPADLERYMYQFRVGPSPDAIRALMRLLPEERRSLWAGKVADYA